MGLGLRVLGFRGHGGSGFMESENGSEFRDYRAPGSEIRASGFGSGFCVWGFSKLGLGAWERQEDSGEGWRMLS